MTIKPFLELSFLNPDWGDKFIPCTECNGKGQRFCKTCLGTGKMCRICLNTGREVATGMPCACGMSQQFAFIREAQSLLLQSLFIPDAVNLPDSVIPTDKTLAKLDEENYRHLAKNGTWKTRFCYTNIQPDEFFKSRFKLLRKLSEKKHKAKLRGFIYINVLELNNPEYVEALEKLLMNSKDAVYVYMGLNTMLPQSIYPYIPLITRYMSHPAFFFCTQEWHEAYISLNTILIDPQPAGTKTKE